jgi:hypothetical protein
VFEAEVSGAASPKHPLASESTVFLPSQRPKVLIPVEKIVRLLHRHRLLPIEVFEAEVSGAASPKHPLASESTVFLPSQGPKVLIPVEKIVLALLVARGGRF